jgi:hydrogenase-4 component B
MNTHRLDLNEIRGFGRKKPLLAGCFLVGALAIGGIPGFSGYISKTLLHESILEYGGGAWMKALEILFIVSGGLTVAYMTKLFVTIFIEKNTDSGRQRAYEQKTHYAGAAALASIVIPAVCLLVWGVPAVMDGAADGANSFFLLAGSERVHYFSGENLLGACYSIGIGALVYLLVIRGLLTKKNERGERFLINPWPDWLDLENLIYRPLLRALAFLALIPCRMADTAVDWTVVLLRKTIYRDTPLPREYSQGNSLTRGLGRLCNYWRDLANHTWRRRSPIETDYVELVNLRADELNENTKIITRSISFGLLLFGLGFCLMLFYLIAGDL